MSTESCINTDSSTNRRKALYRKKLNLLIFIKDTLERRIASLNASISTLQQQIDRLDEVNSDLNSSN